MRKANSWYWFVKTKYYLQSKLILITTKGYSENDQIIQNFWQMLFEFSAEERSMYLRFVWGRSRLPLSSKDFPMKHRIEM